MVIPQLDTEPTRITRRLRVFLIRMPLALCPLCGSGARLSESASCSHAIATLIFGLLVSPNCYAVAAGMALSSIMLTLQILGPVDTITMGNMRLLDPWFPIPEELQQWAEQWCDLGFSEQKQKQQPFLLMLGFSALAFGFFRLSGTHHGVHFAAGVRIAGAAGAARRGEIVLVMVLSGIRGRDTDLNLHYAFYSVRCLGRLHSELAVIRPRCPSCISGRHSAEG